MQELIQDLGRYIAGGINSDEFCSCVREFLAAHPERREEARVWFETGEKSGRLSPAIGQLVRDLFKSVAAADSDATVVKGANRAAARASAAVAPAAPAAAVPPAAFAAVFEAAPAVESNAVAAAPTPAAGTEERRLHPLQIGAVLLNRYRLVEELGRGGMGQVFKAVDRYLEGDGKRNPFIALKALNAAYIEDNSARTGLLDEAMRAKTLSHENIVRVDNFDWDGPYIFITMEYLRGKSLDALIRSDYSTGQAVAAAWPIIEKIGDALEFAHRKGVVHSDVKPSNILITTKNAVKVLDFGISRLMARSAAVQTETQYASVAAAVGLTPAYASLEQWRGEDPDPRDDIYSFALVVYEMLTGHHPFAGAPATRALEAGLLPKRIETLSRTQWDALRSALALSREQRTKTVKQFQRAFAPTTFMRKHRMAMVGSAATLIAAGIVVGSHEYSNHVEQQMLCAGHPVRAVNPVLTPAQRQRVGDDLFLAEDYLRDIKLDQQPDDLAYVLSEGANNVNQILDSILALDARNSPALRMKNQIAELYLRKARQLRDQNQLPVALQMIRNGLKVACDNLDLFHLQRDVCEANTALCETG
jgi:serine/threonine protein kinase